MALSISKSKFIRISPYKLRLIIDLLRGKSVAASQAYLRAHMTKRAQPILKAIDSAFANAKNLHKDVDSPDKVIVKKIFVDEGPVVKYFKPAAMGRAAVQRKRMSHITVVLDKEDIKKER